MYMLVIVWHTHILGTNKQNVNVLENRVKYSIHLFDGRRNTALEQPAIAPAFTYSSENEYYILTSSSLYM